MILGDLDGLPKEIRKGLSTSGAGVRHDHLHAGRGQRLRDIVNGPGLLVEVSADVEQHQLGGALLGLDLFLDLGGQF